MRFDGRVAIVTGSGRGLGAAYSSLLAQRGASVVVHDAGVSAEGSGGDPSVADQVVAQITGSGGTAIASYQNLSSREACQQVMRTAIDRFGRLDILIHNAGLLSFTALEETSPELFERMCQVHVSAPFWLSQAAWPHMQHQHYGRMVFTTSGRALTIESAQPGLSVYAMGKIASLGLMHVLALEREPWGIRVNAIAPVAATRMLQRQVWAWRIYPGRCGAWSGLFGIVML